MMWFRGTLPRFRIDHLLDFCWKFLVPVSIVLMIAVAIVVKLFNPVGLATPGLLLVIGEFFALLIVNVGVGGAALFFVSRAARQGRNKTLRSVTAVDAPAPASK
jgi:NADH-quinone oxidoreductase subunit H